MNRKYVKPEIKLTTVQQEGFFCTSTGVQTIQNNADVEYGGGGSGPVRSRGTSVWDDDQDY